MRTDLRRFLLAGFSFGLLALAGCAPGKLLSHEANPAYAGKRFDSVLVHAVAYDRVLRRVFEDRMVAALAARGIRGVASYPLLERDGETDEARLREVVARSGASGVMITRPGAEERATTTISGGTVISGTGGYGLYGYYAGVWQAVDVAPKKVGGSTWRVSSTRLFDAATGEPAWMGSVQTPGGGDPVPAIQRYVDLVVAAMARDRVL